MVCWLVDNAQNCSFVLAPNVPMFHGIGTSSELGGLVLITV